MTARECEEEWLREDEECQGGLSMGPPSPSSARTLKNEYKYMIERGEEKEGEKVSLKRRRELKEVNSI